MLTKERLRELLFYNPSSGEWLWQAWISLDGRVIHICPAGYVDEQGYIQIEIDGAAYKAHRLAFLYMLGRWPDPECDHSDLIRCNNSWDNLREATNSQNIANSPLRKDNTSGFKGVHFRKETGKYIARIGVNNKRIRLGDFDCPAAASFAYQVAADIHFGEFARIR